MTRVRTATVLVVVALLLVLASGSALQADEERKEITFEAPIPVVDLIKQVSNELDLPLVWDPKSRALQNKEVMGDVRLVGTKEEILRGLGSLLTYYELVIIPTGSGENLKYLLLDARQTAAIVKLKPIYVELDETNLDHFEKLDGVFLTTTIKVEHMESLRDARNALNRIVTGQNIGNVTEVPAARAFVVTDFAPNVVAVYRLLRKMDVPPDERGAASAASESVFQAVRLKHASAEDAALTLISHFAANGPADQQRVHPAQRQQTGEVPPRPGLRINADARLNQLLVSGMRKDVDRVLLAVQAIDQPVPQMSATVQVIRLEHINAIQTANALNQMIRRFPGPWLSAPGSKDLPAVEAHAETNSVLLHGSEAAATMLRRVLTDLDQAEASAEAPKEALAPDLVSTRLDTEIDLVVDSAPLIEVLDTISKATGVSIVVTPKARRTAADGVSISVEGVSARLALDMLVKSSDVLAWSIRDGVVLVHLVNERY